MKQKTEISNGVMSPVVSPINLNVTFHLEMVFLFDNEDFVLKERSAVLTFNCFTKEKMCRYIIIIILFNRHHLN